MRVATPENRLRPALDSRRPSYYSNTTNFHHNQTVSFYLAKADSITLKLWRPIAGGLVLLVLGVAAIAAPSPPAIPPPELQKARDDLRLSQETRDRIASEVAALKASGKASPEVVTAYETYLARVQDMVVENQNLVARMETAYSAHQTPSHAATAPVPGAEPEDRVKALDRQFNESLAAFDEMLLRELRILQAASARRMKGLAEAAAEAGRQAGEKGRGAAGEKDPSAEGAEGSAPEATKGEKAGAGSDQAKTSGSGKSGEAAGASQEAGGWGSGGTGAPPSTYTPSADDDIVARQLREAAERETDPELKAKLWKEYEEYKKSRAKP